MVPDTMESGSRGSTTAKAPLDGLMGPHIRDSGVIAKNMDMAYSKVLMGQFTMASG
jgi:hypothetical protein